MLGSLVTVRSSSFGCTTDRLVSQLSVAPLFFFSAYFYHRLQWLKIPLSQSVHLMVVRVLSQLVVVMLQLAVMAIQLADVLMIVWFQVLVV